MVKRERWKVRLSGDNELGMPTRLGSRRSKNGRRQMNSLDRFNNWSIEQ